MASISPNVPSAEAFIQHWSAAEASERANAQQFLIELADLLQVPRPSNTHADGYSFEYPVNIPLGDASFSAGRLDLYRRGSFVLEAKQFATPVSDDDPAGLARIAEQAGVYLPARKSGPLRGTGSWDDAMLKARGQAERYARSLPASEPTPPFLLVVDVGHSLEVFADFTQAGKAYLPFPDPRSFRIRLADLASQEIREIAGYLATLAASLEKSGQPPRLVAEFLTRCLFCMFAEDVGLLPKDGFRNLLESLRDHPEGFVPKLRILFAEMQTGTDYSVILNQKLLRFNGGLFEQASVLPLDATQLGILILAARQQWKDVEPAIFGTLLERALDPEERHQLGAHYTPRAYVERLVLPTVVEPLRAEWESVRTAAVVHAQAGRLPEARKEILSFHSKLCETTVLDPACGSGNFLYVALEHLKRLEGEVLDAAADFGENLLLDISTHSVDPHQFLGMELNPRAASITEMVLWIGYLQWHFRTRGQTLPAEPVLRKFHNIECRDAVLAWDGEPVPLLDESGQPVSVWDRKSKKIDPVTGREVPDESKRRTLLSYPSARPAEWPRADYIVGNPPFIGNKRMRDALGDGYVDSLRSAYPSVPGSADFVMFWWAKAAKLVSEGKTRHSGLITTNSITQVQSGQIVQQSLEGAKPVSLVYAIPDHPWVDSSDGAAVRIAMTVIRSGSTAGKLLSIVSESEGQEGAAKLLFSVRRGAIHANFEIGSDARSVLPLKANERLCWQGCKLVGEHFQITPEKYAEFVSEEPDAAARMPHYFAGSDITKKGTPRHVIDLYGLSKEEAFQKYPALMQHLTDYVKPERDQNKDLGFRTKWWIFGRPRPDLRDACSGIARYIVTSEVAKHRTFTFLQWPRDLIDGGVIAIASEDAFVLGVLSSRIHVSWAVSAGGRMGKGNDPRYQNGPCFDPFPFPDATETQRSLIRDLAARIESHRKRQQSLHPNLQITDLYNVLEAHRDARPLTAKEKVIHEQGLVSVLRQLHEELDAAVAEAYGWGDLWEARTEAHRGTFLNFKTGLVTQSDAGEGGLHEAIAEFEQELDQEILIRLVALNAERAAEEAAGTIRYLRPEYQNPGGNSSAQSGLKLTKEKAAKSKVSRAKIPWPKSLAERVRAVESALKDAGKPVTAAILTKRFARAKEPDTAEILETLVTLGRAHQSGETYSV